ncbi:hypothetical protein ACQPYA_20540 [Micromonospora sp. CA-263727]|uniref:hypothetical protein n=1 Tax=Micromonospora sp. CA-263727 TaxID=3239967 RepID=UPI003D8F7D13
MTATLSAVVTVLGALAATVALVATGSWPTALRVLLDMLVAAGLLRLTGNQGWPDLAAVAAVVVLRLVLRTALVQDYRRWRSPGAGRPAEHAGRPPGP